MFFSQIKNRFCKKTCPQFKEIKRQVNQHIWEREEYGRFNNNVATLYEKFGCKHCSVFYRNAVHCPRRK